MSSIKYCTTGQLFAQLQTHVLAQTRRFAKRVQVSQSERQRHGFLQIDVYVLTFRGLPFPAVLASVFTFSSLPSPSEVRPARDIRFPNITRSRKFYAIFRHRNSYRIANRRQISANSLKFVRGHLHRRFVLRIRDAQMFRIDIHQLHLKIRNFIRFPGFQTRTSPRPQHRPLSS